MDQGSRLRKSRLLSSCCFSKSPRRRRRSSRRGRGSKFELIESSPRLCSRGKLNDWVRIFVLSSLPLSSQITDVHRQSDTAPGLTMEICATHTCTLDTLGVRPTVRRSPPELSFNALCTGRRRVCGSTILPLSMAVGGVATAVRN